MFGRTLPPKVMLLEFNEITWSLIDPWIQNGTLPNFARIKGEGAWGTPISNDVRPFLNPWITWVTVHCGVDNTVHGVQILGQEAQSIKYKRTWEYAAESHKKVGIFGSIGAYPPQPYPGFMIPGPFAPDSKTQPPNLQPIQDLNRKYTQVHNKLGKKDSIAAMVRQGLQLLRFGLKPATIKQILFHLVNEKIHPEISWQRVCLQAIVNFDFFKFLYRKHKPDYCTWQTNHAAHFMHHYWRAMDDTMFPSSATEKEKKRYGTAVEFGYRLLDELLGKFMDLVDDNTVLVVASSMGQQPYVSERYPDGRITVRIRDIHRLLKMINCEDASEVVPVMAPEWNVTILDEEKRSKVKESLLAVYRQGFQPRVFDVKEMGNILRIAPKGLAQQEKESRVFFPKGVGVDKQGYRFEDLFDTDDPTPKEGVHHPEGVLVLWGPGIKPGVEFRDITNIDIAPTILSILGVPVPPVMKGRVLSEAWETSRTTPDKKYQEVYSL